MERLAHWLKCTNCELHKFRRSVVLGQGDIPADLLFAGEGPGKSEDLRGFAFVGVAGRLLREGNIEALQRSGRAQDPPRMFITNLCACHPTDKYCGDNREPTSEEIAACWPRFVETVNLVKPRLIVCLGNLAYNQCKRFYPNIIKLMHPSGVRRRGGFQSTEYRKFVRGLTEIFKEQPRRKVNRQRRRK